MFSPNIQNYINTSGEAAAKARIRQLGNYVSGLTPQSAEVAQTTVSKPFSDILKTTAAENNYKPVKIDGPKGPFELDLPPAISPMPSFGEITKRTGTTKEQILDLIEKSAQRHGVDEKLVKAIVKQESGFNPNAKSSAGALGLMQLMPATANGLGVVDPMNPAQNIEGGVKYFKSMLNRFRGNTILALAAYNAGPNAVEKYGSVPPYPETQNYVQSILKDYL